MIWSLEVVSAASEKGEETRRHAMSDVRGLNLIILDMVRALAREIERKKRSESVYVTKARISNLIRLDQTKMIEM